MKIKIIDEETIEIIKDNNPVSTITTVKQSEPIDDTLPMDLQDMIYNAEGDILYNSYIESKNTQHEYEDWGIESFNAEYQGKPVSLNKPFRTPGGSKKFGVYVKNSKGNVIIVRFGDPNMEIKRDDAERRKSFRARHKCDQQKDPTTAAYWSCKMWSNPSVTKIINN